MTKIAYFDCFSGCSGDMMLGALLDAGLDFEKLKTALAGLRIPGYQLAVEKVKRTSITAAKFNVIMDEHFHQHHRALSEILRIISDSGLSDSVKHKSSRVFQRLGEVEAKVHGVAVEDIHFHEIGAVDSIIDIVGTVYALEAMQIERCYSSALPVGYGNIKTAHGLLPAPAPATLQILAEAGAPIADTPQSEQPPGELLTPTGAVLISLLASFERPKMRITNVGYGAGNKEFKEWPNVLRVWIGEASDKGNAENLILLETNIDDMNPQVYGYLMDKLFTAKAADVWFTPIQMKKNRPAVMLSVLASSDLESELTDIIMRETSTLGIRVRPVSRHAAQREIVEVDSSLGRAKVKVKRLAGKIVDISPEYEDCRRIAEEKQMPLREVMRIVGEEARRNIK